MKKFALIVFMCFTLAMTSANAEIFKDSEGFSYISNPNYLVFTAGATGSGLAGVYDLSSVHILALNLM